MRRVTINVVAGNTAPVANPDRKTTNEDTPITFPASDLTANDTDAEHDPLMVTSVGAASNGTVSLAGGNVMFTPAANRNSPSTTFGLSYAISDGNGGTDTVKVTIRGSHLLDPTPQHLNPSGTVTINWTVPAGSATLDWIGLFRVGDPNTSYDRFRSFYTGGAASGSRTISLPTTPGQYEFRYFLNNSFTLVARSVTVTVGTITCPTVSHLSATHDGIRSGVIITGVKELWEPIIKIWFTEGVDDPRITVLKVTPTDGYYWDNKHGNAVAGIKMMIGAMLGKTLDNSIEGKLAV